MSKRIKLVNVRSPLEFAKGHIPGAISLPLMDDHARKEVGTTYKKKDALQQYRLDSLTSDLNSQN